MSSSARSSPGRVTGRSRSSSARAGGALLKPLAWQRVICNGPSAGKRVTFTRHDQWLPGWNGIPEPEEAARVVIPAYLHAHGPATMEAFDNWLTRGSKAAGWISPVVVAGGRVAGTWTLDGNELAVALFEEAGGVSRAALEGEADRIGAFLDRNLTLAVTHS